MSVEAVRALVAAFSGDDAWRSIKAKLQRRDRYGRFAEMGGGFSFSLKLGNGEMRRVSGKIVGESGEEDLDVEIKDNDTLPDGVYSIPSRKGEAVKAILSKEALEKIDRDKSKSISDDVYVDVADLKTAKKKKPKQQQEPEKKRKVSKSPFKRGGSRTSKFTVEDPIDAEVAFADENGYLEQRTVPRSREVTDPVTGEKTNITSQREANEFVKNGGALSDVPDMYVMGAIEENSGPRERFNIIGDGGGVNGMTRMIDTATGAYIGTKYHSGESAQFEGRRRVLYGEPVNEAFAEVIAELFGFEPMPMRLVKSANGSGVSLITELAQNRWGGVTTPLDDETVDEYGGLKVTMASFAHMLLLDSIIGNEDRHNANYMLKKINEDEYEIIPIDHSTSFMPEYVGTEQFLPTYLSELGEYGLKIRDAEITGDPEYEEFLDILGDLIADLAKINPEVLEIKINQIFDHLEAMFPNNELYPRKDRALEISRMLGEVMSRIAFILGEPVEVIAQSLLSSLDEW